MNIGLEIPAPLVLLSELVYQNVCIGRAVFMGGSKGEGEDWILGIVCQGRKVKLLVLCSPGCLLSLTQLTGFFYCLLSSQANLMVYFKLFFLQHLIERSWYAVTETCLAFTVFRDDFSPRFVALFTVLLFLKCFHWLAEDRVDYVRVSLSLKLIMVKCCNLVRSQ